MKAIKFLWDRHLDFITWISTAGFPAWWKVLIGFLEILCIICVFIISEIFTTWYIALAITAGSILGICIAMLHRRTVRTAHLKNRTPM